MKRIMIALLAAALLLGAAGCGPDDFSQDRPGQASSAVSDSLAGSEPNESTPTDSSPVNGTAHESPTASSTPEPTPRPAAVAGDGGDLDLLALSPYYSGQEGLLEDICHASTRKPPESFYWLNEDTARAAWGIDDYVSACCSDFVACFSFQRPTESQMQEWFFVFVALFPGVDVPGFDTFGTSHFTPAEDWTPVENHSGFETRKVETLCVPYTESYMDYGIAVGNSSPTPEPTPFPLPDVVQIRWQIDGLWAMVQLPESGLDAFWENVDQLFVQVDPKNVDLPFYMSSDDPAVSEAGEE